MPKKIINDFISSTNKTEQGRPPDVVESLVSEITRIGLHRFKALPQANTASEIARLWIANNQPANQQFECPREVPAIGKDGSRWVCPYHQRLIGTLRVFSLLSPTDQQTILSCIQEEKVWWRGESIKDYFNVVLETKRMRSTGIKRYREEAITKMRQFLGHTIVDNEAKIERDAIQAEHG